MSTHADYFVLYLFLSLALYLPAIYIISRQVGIYLASRYYTKRQWRCRTTAVYGFFVNVNGDTLIEPLSTCVTADHPAKSEYVAPVTARQHIMNKYLASMGVDNA